MNTQQPPRSPNEHDQADSRAIGGESAQAIPDKAKMLVGLSASLGLPLGNDGSPELQDAIKLAQAEYVPQI